MFTLLAYFGIRYLSNPRRDWEKGGREKAAKNPMKTPTRTWWNTKAWSELSPPGLPQTIRGVGRKLRQLPSPDTTSMLEVTILVPYVELEHSIERSSRKRVKHTL